VNTSSADFATSETADRLLDLHLEEFEDQEIDPEDQLDDFNWVGSRHHY
jgi:hypothetical protein